MSWDECVATALLGTARRPAPPRLVAGSPLDALVGRLPGADPESTLLAAGAAVGLYRQAGYRPAVDREPPPAAAPPEHRRRCSAAAAETLVALLADNHRPLVAEWLATAGAAGVRVPEELLPLLLDLGRARAETRTALLPVLGERGPWLAALNDGWAWAARTGDDQAWVSGDHAARLAFLARLRAADPAGARDLLAAAWPHEAADARTAFAAVLATNLSLDDEPFLEAALADRRKEVRRVAAGLLAALPGSRRARRMAERLRPLITVPLAVALPAEVDSGIVAGMVADGIEPRPPRNRGERAWWLQQLVAAAPLAVWQEVTGLDPEGIVEQGLGGDQREPLLAGWVAAALRQRNAEWAGALLAFAHEPRLLEVLPARQAEDESRRWVAERGLHDGAVLALLAHVPAPWSAAFSLAVIDALAAAVDRRGAPLLKALPDLALRLAPAVAAEAASRLEGRADAYWINPVGRLLDVLDFRRRMHQELSS